MKPSTPLHLAGTLLITALSLVSASLPSQAEIVLAIPDPAYGVLALNSSTKTFTSATTNPATATVDGAKASMNLSGSTLSFNFTVGNGTERWYQATTGDGKIPTDGKIGPLGVQIVGSAGEKNGTPVSLTLDSVFTGTDTILVTLLANGNDYPGTSSSVINGLHVGDTFELWAGLGASSSESGTMTTTLTVNSLGTTPVPEPGSLALLMAGGLALGGLVLRYRRVRPHCRP